MPSTVGLRVGHEAVLADVHVFAQQRVLRIFVGPTTSSKDKNQIFCQHVLCSEKDTFLAKFSLFLAFLLMHSEAY